MNTSRRVVEVVVQLDSHAAGAASGFQPER